MGDYATSIPPLAAVPMAKPFANQLVPSLIASMTAPMPALTTVVMVVAVRSLGATSVSADAASTMPSMCPQKNQKNGATSAPPAIVAGRVNVTAVVAPLVKMAQPRSSAVSVRLVV